MWGRAGLSTLTSLGPHRAAGIKEPNMEPVIGNDTNALRPKYETRTFNPRSAFSWTLRAGEIARLEARRQRDGAGEPRRQRPSITTRSAS